MVPCDYDTNPGRWAANQAFRPAGNDLSGLVSQRIIARDAAGPVRVPVRLTKRGTLIWARRPA